MKRALLLALLLLMPSAPAYAATSLGHPVTVSSMPCATVLTDLGNDGVSRGFAQCNGTIEYVQGTSSGWVTRRSPYGGTLVAAASDGRTTYALILTNSELRIVSHEPGKFTNGRRLDASGYMFSGYSLIAAGGRWWAVWSRAGDAGYAAMYEAQTLGRSYATHRFWGAIGSGLYDVEPSLAYQPTTRRAVLVWTHGHREGSDDGIKDPSVVMSVSTDGDWSAARSVDAHGGLSVVAVTGSTVVIADGHGVAPDAGTGIYIGTTSGGFRFRQIDGAKSVGVTAAPGHVVVGIETQSATTQIQERVAGVWSTSSYDVTPEDLDASGSHLRLIGALHSTGVLSALSR